jgi:hypothetical protein
MRHASGQQTQALQLLRLLQRLLGALPLRNIGDEAEGQRAAAVSIVLRPISTGNSLPSFRRPESSMPRPIARVRGARK